MAERRMFAKTIVLSDAFLDMPLSARCLYFTLGMLADDDGFINSPKSIMRQCGASNDDMNILLAKKFLIAFESGVFVIKHWRINNYLRSDRYTETKYIEEKSKLLVDGNGGYTVGIPSGTPSIDKVRIGQEESKKERDIYQEKNSNHTRENPVVSHADIMREYNLSDMVCESLKGFLRHCYLNKHIVSNEKLEDIVFRLIDKFDDDKSRIECIERAVSGGYFDIKA